MIVLSVCSLHRSSSLCLSGVCKIATDVASNLYRWRGYMKNAFDISQRGFQKWNNGGCEGDVCGRSPVWKLNVKLKCHSTGGSRDIQSTLSRRCLPSTFFLSVQFRDSRLGHLALKYVLDELILKSFKWSSEGTQDAPSMHLIMIMQCIQSLSQQHSLIPRLQMSWITQRCFCFLFEEGQTDGQTLNH